MGEHLWLLALSLLGMRESFSYCPAHAGVVSAPGRPNLVEGVCRKKEGFGEAED